MTVAELIEQLQSLPSDAIVLTPGFDEGPLETVRVDLVSLTQVSEIVSTLTPSAVAPYKDTDFRPMETLAFRDDGNGPKVQAVVVNFNGKVRRWV